ncbi:MAG: PorP/SprF family type IX secretion system membrane protein [Saprospiraceae bacterium]|nr:PorP/SprF family type IX secretion system membrane protein [Saprospiraceae bacterium]
MRISSSIINNLCPSYCYRNILIVVIFFGIIHLNKAQDVVFSQFQAIPLINNPAFGGISTAPRVSLQYRNQWPQLNNAYNTYCASYDQFYDKLKTGFGLTLLSDNAGNGILKNNAITGTFAYKLKAADDLYFRFGANLTFNQSRINWNKLIFYDQIDPYTGFTTSGGLPIESSENRPPSQKISYFDLGSGLLLYSSKFNLGASLFHLNTPEYNFLSSSSNLKEGLPLRLVLMGGYQIPLKYEKKNEVASYLYPSFLYTKQVDFNQLNVGISYGTKNYLLGAALRHTFSNADAVIVTAGFVYQILKIVYSYDITISGLSGYSGGAHEISLQVAMKENKKIDYNDCFQIFR